MREFKNCSKVLAWRGKKFNWVAKSYFGKPVEIYKTNKTIKKFRKMV